MTPREVALEFLQQKIEEWSPTPLQYIQTKGAEALCDELAKDQGLSRLCGWLAKPTNEELTGAVIEFVSLANPTLNAAATTLAEAVVCACAKRHQLNRDAALHNIGVGTVILVALIAAEGAGGGGS